MSITRKIAVGDRVAIAPHHDLWMAGCRYATVTSIGPDAAFYFVDLDTGRNVTLDREHILAPITFTLNDGA